MVHRILRVFNGGQIGRADIRPESCARLGQAANASGRLVGGPPSPEAERRRVVIDFYKACKRFRRGEAKAIGCKGTIRQLRWALTAATFSPDPGGPEAA